MSVDHAVAPNPHADRVAGSERSYHGMSAGVLSKLRPAFGEPDPGVVAAHSEFRSTVLEDAYTCVAARSAVRRGDYRFGRYAPLGTEAAAQAMAADLWDFIADYPIRTDRFASFVASFAGPAVASELEFEGLLWRQLQLLHDLDAEYASWDPTVSADPQDLAFSFSFGGRAFFIVGMHQQSSRIARRLSWPTLVFNAHAQFDILRETERIERIKQVNRSRDVRVQGSYNPSLDRFDHEPETIMYSGRLVEADWSCPLQVHDQSPAAEGEARA